MSEWVQWIPAAAVVGAAATYIVREVEIRGGNSRLVSASEAVYLPVFFDADDSDIWYSDYDPTDPLHGGTGG